MGQPNPCFVHVDVQHVELCHEGALCRNLLHKLRSTLEALRQSRALEVDCACLVVAREISRLFDGCPRLKLYVAKDRVLVKTSYGLFVVCLKKAPHAQPACASAPLPGP